MTKWAKDIKTVRMLVFIVLMILYLIVNAAMKLTFNICDTNMFYEMK